jgi:acetoacetyl-CoA reductase
VAEKASSNGMGGQVALVTGGVRGIGLAICERLLRRGTFVAAGYSRNEERARQFVETHGGDGKASVHQGNIANSEDCERVVEEVFDRHGRLDILVNNAGITVDKTVRKMSSSEWDHVIEVNLNGAFYMARAALPHMIERGYGRIVNISSVIGETGNIGQANYAAAKSGLFGLTMTLALESANKGITVNCVAPGFIETDMVAAVPREILDQIIAQIPTRRLGAPDEVARVVEFIADPESGYITGQVYSINGGLNM